MLMILFPVWVCVLSVCVSFFLFLMTWCKNMLVLEMKEIFMLRCLKCQLMSCTSRLVYVYRHKNCSYHLCLQRTLLCTHMICDWERVNVGGLPGFYDMMGWSLCLRDIYVIQSQEVEWKNIVDWCCSKASY